MRLGDLFFAGNWRTIPLEGLTFPGGCSQCGKETSEIRRIRGEAKSSVLGVLGQLAAISSTVTVTVPHCTECQSALRRRRAKWMIVGAALGALLGGAMAWSMSFERLAEDASWQSFYRGAAFFVGVALGLAGGWYRGGLRLPVRVRRYSKKDETIQIWFENPDYRKEFVALRESGTETAGDGETPNRAKRKRRTRKR